VEPNKRPINGSRKPNRPAGHKQAHFVYPNLVALQPEGWRFLPRACYRIVAYAALASTSKYGCDLSKLEPLSGPFRSLAESQNSGPLQDWRGETDVAAPIAPAWPLRTDSALSKNGQCWAVVRIRASSNFTPDFEGCKNVSRSGYLTCRVHFDRELAARQLKCETEKVTMDTIAYTSVEDKEAERRRRRAEIAKKHASQPRS
jgi:hypothetical protein